MDRTNLNNRLAVCSWSLRPKNPEDLAQQLKTIGISRVQLALDPLRDEPAVWGNCAEILSKNGISIVSGMFGTIGEDYTTLETIKRTGGVVPDATWNDNWSNIQKIADIAEKLGLKLVTFHAGFLPHESTDPAFEKLLQRIVQIADLFGAKGIDLGFETGQETADTLSAFLKQLNRKNVGVNFDPANMILYGKGNPIAALRTLGRWLKQCHIKDATRSQQPGTWGAEVATGTGEVNWRAFFQTIDELGFKGNFSIEREAGEQRVTDIIAARKHIESILPPRVRKPKAKTVNVGVVGIGFMGVTHIKNYLNIPGANVAAICDAVRLPEDGDLSKVTGNIGSEQPIKLDMSVVKGYRDFNEMLANPDVHLVDLCVPTQLHKPLAIAALKAGKHVLCEKPLARRSADAREVFEAAAASKGFFMPAMVMRFWPEWAWLRRAIVENTYGKVLAARFRRVCEAPGWGRENYFKGDQSGGALLDLHIHDVDFIQFCFGRPKSVYASGMTRFSGAIDHVVGHFSFANGAIVVAEGSWLMTPKHGFNMAYTVNFENATIDYDIARGKNALRIYQDNLPGETITLKGEDGYAGELRHLIESIQAGTPPTVVTAADGLSAIEICEAEEKSIQTGQPVTLD